MKKYKLYLLILSILLSVQNVFASTQTFYTTTTGGAYLSGTMNSGYQATPLHSANTPNGQGANQTLFFIRSLNSGSGYYYTRTFLRFDTSSLVGTTISSIVLHLYGDTTNYVNQSTETVNVVRFTSTVNNPPDTELNQFQFISLASSTFANINQSGDNTFNLNDVSVASTTGITSIGLMTSQDKNETVFSGQDNIINFVGSGGTNKPYIVVTYNSPVSGCTDTRALNYNSLAVTEDHSCTYNPILYTNDFASTVNQSSISTAGIPYIRSNSTTGTAFAVGTESISGHKFWTNSANGTSLYINTRYSLTTTRKYVYILSTGTDAPNYSRDCSLTYSGDQGVAIGSSFLTPDGVSVSVKRYTFFNTVGNCFELDNMAVTSGMRIYSIIGSTKSDLFFHNWQEFSDYESTLNYTMSVSSDFYLATSTTLGGCSGLDLGCYISNSFQYIFTPDAQIVSKFKSITLASSTPFSYAYDMGTLRNELFNTSTTSVLSISIPFHFQGTSTATLTLISKSLIEAVPFNAQLRLLLGFLLWIGLGLLIYEQILGVHDNTIIIKK